MGVVWSCCLPKSAWIQEGRGVYVHVGVCQRERVHGMLYFRFGIVSYCICRFVCMVMYL